MGTKRIHGEAMWEVGQELYNLSLKGKVPL